MSVSPPKQNENYTLSPAQYGDTYFEGLRAPETVDGGGVDTPTAEVQSAPTHVDAGSPQARRRRRHTETSAPQPDEPAKPPENSNEIFID
jgi:hypothetical protein